MKHGATRWNPKAQELLSEVECPAFYLRRLQVVIYSPLGGDIEKDCGTVEV